MNQDMKSMIAEIDLMNNKKMYIVKDGKIIDHDLPEYGEITIVILGGRIDRIETTTKRKI
ncbi:DUF3954 domain-containing protein [Niallia circulans]|uniref:DUF3954 domain-containing protein n=1 Tax=Niallia circulans TaxID=1397 RepID=UPI0035182FE9